MVKNQRRHLRCLGVAKKKEVVGLTEEDVDVDVVGAVDGDEEVLVEKRRSEEGELGQVLTWNLLVSSGHSRQLNLPKIILLV
jgi:hypothetical protein